MICKLAIDAYAHWIGKETSVHMVWFYTPPLCCLCLYIINWLSNNLTTANLFSTPHFSGESYMMLVGWKVPSTSFDLRLTIIPLEASGVLLYSGDMTGRKDFVSLVLNNGFVEMR